MKENNKINQVKDSESLNNFLNFTMNYVGFIRKSFPQIGGFRKGSLSFLNYEFLSPYGFERRTHFFLSKKTYLYNFGEKRAFDRSSNYATRAIHLALVIGLHILHVTIPHI